MVNRKQVTEPMPAAGPATAASKLDIGFNENGLVFLGAAILLGAAVFWVVRSPLLERTDFTSVYTAAFMVRTGDSSKLYDVQEQRRVQERLFKRPGLLVALHPPFEALLFAPLSKLSFKAAYMVWGAINILLWFAFVYLIRPYAPVPKQAFQYSILCFAFCPLWVALFQGQTSVLLLLIYTLTFLSLKQQQDFRAGVLLGLGLLKFQLVLPFAIIFGLRRKWRFLEGFSLSAALLGALSLFSAGGQGVLTYLRLLVHVGKDPANVSTSGPAVEMPTLQGFVYGVLGHRASFGAISLVVAVGSVLLIGFTAWRWIEEDRKGTGSALGPMFAATVAVSLMTGFHMFIHDLSSLILPLFLVAAYLPGLERAGLRRLLKAVLVIFWMAPLYFVLAAWHGLFLMFPVLLAFGLGALSLARGLEDGVRPLEERSA